MADVISLKPPLAIPVPAPVYQEDNNLLERVIALNNQSCLVALDKTLGAIRRAPRSYAAASARCCSILVCVQRLSRDLEHYLNTWGRRV